MRIPVLAIFLVLAPAASSQVKSQPALGHRHVPLLELDGLRFKDLNQNGRLDAFEDWRLPAETRARDLVARLSIEEIAGLMVHGTLPTAGGAASIGRGSTYDFDAAGKLIGSRHVNSFITRLSADPAAMAEASNRLQEIAESTQPGIPLTISTDPRSHFLYVVGASVDGGGFSKWPETTGLAAIGDPALVRSFANIVREEYLAVGIREALSPQADLATEPRWSRMNGTFGEDAEVARKMVQAYVKGMQNGAEGLNSGSVSAVVKHWVGYGAQKEGLDSHNSYSQIAIFPGNNFSYHLIPFMGAFDAHVAAVMPTYSILRGVSIEGTPLEQVGAGANKQLLTGLLRGKYKFDGVILSDWAIANDCDDACQHGAPAGKKPSFIGFGTDWGTMDLPRVARFAKIINAGVDQIGGTEDSSFLLQAEHQGLLTRARMEESAVRILKQKFELGLFEDPYSDPVRAVATLGNPDSLRAGEEAQKRSVVLLENKKELLPLRSTGKKVYLYGIDAKIAVQNGFMVVDTPSQADLAIIRADAPFEVLHPQYTFGSRQHEGRLDFRAGDGAYDALVKASAAVPTIFTVYLDRPAILTNVKEKASALLANFGITDAALFEVLTGKVAPGGHLPFELPSSVEAVLHQKEDLPHDSADPLYPYGYALKADAAWVEPKQ